LTDVADSELNEMTKAIEAETVNPMDLKKQLSLNITSQFHGSEKALSAQSNFEKVVQRRLMPDDMPEMGFHVEGAGDQLRMLFVRLDGTSDSIKSVTVSGQMEVSIFDLLFNTGLVASMSEAKRLVGQGAVEINHRKITEGVTPVHDGLTIKAGRRRFLRLIDFDAR
jgi:tyrosyl-tRNA synthetase